MKKASLLTVFLLPTLLMAGVPAHAQVYSPYQTTTYGSCVSLTAAMTIGSSDYTTGGQVSRLQSYLAQSGLMYGSVTGYFGSVTAAAVAQFQGTHGIAPSGVVGPLTRAAIQQASCGGVVTPTYPTTVYPLPPTYPTYPTYPSYPYNNGVVLNSLSVNNGYIGSTITLNGYGFDAYSNTIHFGGSSLTAGSPNGTTITFTVPSVTPGTYPIYVSNSRGSTNSLSFVLNNNYNNNCNYYGNSYQCGCTYQYNQYSTASTWNNYCQNNTNAAPILSSIRGSSSVSSGNRAAWTYDITEYAAQRVDVTVNWGDNSSNDTFSTYLSGTQTLTSDHVYYSTGNYTIRVTAVNASGATVYQTYTVNVYGNSNYGSPYISYLSPNNGAVGSGIVIQGSGFSSYGNTVHFGNGGAMNLQSYNNGSTIYFTIPRNIGGCDLVTGNQPCPQYLQLVTPGSYPMYVTTNNGQTSNTMYFTVR